uniref:Presqualene diphosphate synthase n=1 Tax=Botryococcus braunii TaxID=38881 RepID=PSDS_BOTBR|nr:RecName: Full=Presqualene diphosphate synthase; AltName: Full=Squalene synthase-like 1 [Botryococcus braunii]AEL16715.1 squalene synthase-like 1 [Botryococcus braunii]|eukprot:jgi/Botrbrau1/12037/Bobra.0293s0013.1
MTMHQDHGVMKDLVKHPNEFPYLLQLAATTYGSPAAPIPKEPDRAFCYNTLHTVSKGFPRFVMRLPQELQDPICIFYLLLRALDTVEDDMNLKSETKISLLRVFHEHCSDRNWSMKSDYGIYADLMERFPLVVSVLEKLPPATQQTFRENVKYMGNGMADFIDKQILTVDEYDLYCHYVAGSCGIAVTKVIVQFNLATPEADSYDFSNSLGLLLQKANIITDYNEDINEEPRPRMFWPQEIWGKYAEKLADFNEPENIDTAVKCLNHMVTDAMRHIEPSLKGMVYFTDKTVFRALALLLVTAFGHLSTLYNNPNVFKEKVRQRKGRIARLVMSSRNVPGLFRTCLKLANNFESRCKQETANDPTVAMTIKRLQSIQATCRDGLAKYDTPSGLKSFCAAPTPTK